jgi:YidC/Oxa1 family membrane protein insertase
MIAANIWDSVREGLGFVLAFFYSIVPNSGVAIILLTVAVRLVLFPLTAKQAKSMIAMQRVQPEIKRLQAKYKNDRQKLNEEMMKFYKENEINPLGGCLPLVLQMPVFFALYQVLENIQKFIPTDSKMFQDICNGAKTASQCKSPDMKFAGMDLTKSASTVASSGFAKLWPYLILVVIVVVTGVVQQRQTMRNQTSPNPQMAIIGKVFPIVFGFISWSIASGVALYFAASNLWQIGQQEVVYRSYGSAAGAAPSKKGRAAVEGSGDADEGGGGTATATKPKPTGRGSAGKASGGRPTQGKSAGGASSPAKSTGKRPTRSTKPTPGGKGSGSGGGTGGSSGGSSNGADGSKNGSGQSRPAGGARSNRKRKR